MARELFHDPSIPITIEATFSDAICFKNKRNFDVSINRVKLTMSLEPELTAKTTVNGNDIFYDQEQFKKLCHFVYIPSERNLSYELRVSQWTMLGKLMRLIYENYISSYNGNEDKLKNDFAEKIRPAKEFLETDFSDDVTFKKFADSFRRHCTINSTGLANEFEPVLDIYNLNWFYKTLQIHVKEDVPNRHFDSEEVGAGMQNLLMISIFQTYAELIGGKVIFGIEEPEIYLYPQAQRTLYKSLIKLSEQTQIFYTTHNTNFVEASRADDIILLRKNTEKGTFKLKKEEYFSSENANDADNQYKIYTHFNPERNELFFAKRVLFVEGESDKILFTTLCEKKWNIDLDKMGVSVIACGGKGGVNYFLGVCKLIGLEDFFAVWDKDRDLESSEFLNSAEQNHFGLCIDPNLEDFLSLPTGEDAEKVKNAHQWAINIEVANIPKEFDSIKLFLKGQVVVDSAVPTTYSSEIAVEDLPF